MLELTQSKKKQQVTLSAADMPASFGSAHCQEEVSTNALTCTGHVQMRVKVGDKKVKEASFPVSTEQ